MPSKETESKGHQSVWVERDRGLEQTPAQTLTTHRPQWRCAAGTLEAKAHSSLAQGWTLNLHVQAPPPSDRVRPQHLHFIQRVLSSSQIYPGLSTSTAQLQCQPSAETCPG